ncbi:MULTISPECIES: restriction endonuclease [Thermodesulfovibrio]|uniref:Mrr restriction system protein n=1 Tax=Thermodesulfovibrio yellowstonii (strain ATCC 51303 / DSM 11347 / YP87) TaxID=289376 RepID=B5YIC3_THEYD|nr:MULTISPECIES: restriction endonuclease [Thermodesulfovibrio]ACI21536.1 Mrr restriction system protein [Thermodesulfovibrio yellowstonii DSM 11347]MDI6864524.1 restriction endonuclease [Thermodesulfovibrio yellowstonii]
MIPDDKTIMLPLLMLLSDEKEIHIKDIVNELAEKFKLTREEKEKLLPRGNEPIFNNRVRWAKTYLQKAGLLEIPRRGFLKITQRGLEVLKEKPDKINFEFLMRFEEFKIWRNLSYKQKKEEKLNIENKSTEEGTPEEVISSKIEEINNLVKYDLKSKIKSLTPEQFERFVIDILLKMGYGGSFEEASQHIGKSHDGGIDGIIKQDILGLDNVYIQAKQWTGNVGATELQTFVGALQGKGKKGVFITTSQFTKNATKYAKSLSDIKVILIDGDKIVDYMMKFKIGVQTLRSYELLKIDEDYFELF